MAVLHTVAFYALFAAIFLDLALFFALSLLLKGRRRGDG